MLDPQLAEACLPVVGGQAGDAPRKSPASEAKQAQPPPMVSVVVISRGSELQACQCVLEIFRTAGEVTSLEVLVMHQSKPDHGAGSTAVPPQASGIPAVGTNHLLRQLGAALTNGLGMPFTLLSPPLELAGADGWAAAAAAAGAAAARGELLVLLTAEVLVMPGWLHALTRTLNRHPVTALVAPLVLSASDGKVVDAGWAAMSNGHLRPLAAPGEMLHGSGGSEGRALQRVDFVSAACLMVRRTVFVEQLQGYYVDYRDGIYARADLGLRLWALGLEAAVQPLAVVLLNGENSQAQSTQAPASPALAAAERQVQAQLHQQQFLQRWQSSLSARECRAAQPGGAPTIAAASAPGGAPWHVHTRVLWVDMTIPEPDRDSGSVRVSALMAILARAGYAITMQPTVMRERGAAYAAAARSVGVRVLPLALPGAWRLAAAGGGCLYDVIVAARYHVYHTARKALAAACPGVPVVLDTVDLHFLREARMAAAAAAARAAPAEQWANAANSSIGVALAWLDAARGRRAAFARATRTAELAAVKTADAVWVVSEDEAALLARLVPGARVSVVSNVIDLPPPVLLASARTPLSNSSAAYRNSGGTACSAAGRAGLLFVGNFEHAPNREALRTLLRDVLPLATASMPPAARASLVLHVVGANARPDAATWLAAAPAPVVFHGWLPDSALRLLYARARVAVAPLLSGAGVKGKVSAAMAAGLPVVVTPLAAEGMHLTDGIDALVAATPSNFASKVVAAYTDDALWCALAAGGRASVDQWFSVAAAERALAVALDAVGAGVPPAWPLRADAVNEVCVGGYPLLLPQDASALETNE